MTIIFYHTSSPKNKIDKTLTDSVSVSGTLKDMTNVENPNILKIDTSVLTSANATLVRNANYAYISEFDRYYYINDKTMRTDKLIDCQLSVDVLMSYASAIKNQNCLIARSEQNSSQYINDSERPAYNFPMVLTKAFGSGFDSFNYYLTVASSVEST